MKTGALLRVLLLFVLLFSPLNLAKAKGSDIPWEQVAEGIEFHEFVLTNPPNHVFVARMARDNSNVTIESGIAQGRLTGGVETVSAQAARYDQSLNNWNDTWGNRSNVIVAINGFYFGPELEDDGVPWSGQVQSGWYAKHFYEYQTVAGFVWKYDRTAFIGECITNPEDKQYIDYETGVLQKFNGINVPREKDQIVIYTPQFDKSTHTKDNGVEVVVEMDSPTTLALARQVPFGTVREIRIGKGNTPIPFDAIVISAQGFAADPLLNNVEIGDRIGIAQKIKHYLGNCATPNTNDWERTYTAIGGQFYFLQKGIITHYSSGEANVRDPRTAVAYNNDYVFFIVVDGRNEGISEGMSIEELAAFVRNTLGAKYGVALDGGGSSTMVINGRVVNHPSDNNYCYHIYLPLVLGGSNQKSGNVPASQSSQSSADDFTNACRQRPVANSLMMVVVESPQYSTTLLPGFFVKTTTNTNLRLGPGSNYAIFAQIPQNSLGRVKLHANGLDGILAKGTYWWLVDFDGKQGWVNEQDILRYQAQNLFTIH